MSYRKNIPMRLLPYLLTCGLIWACSFQETDSKGKIMTVTGPVEAHEMGICLEHEHVVVDFETNKNHSEPRYPERLAFDTLLPYFQKLEKYNVRTFIDGTPNYIGRDVLLLKKLSKETGIQILTNTGYYAAAGKKYIPAHAYHETSQQLSEKWTEEWVNGIADTGIRPGFIKLGVGSGPLDSLERKIVAAGALTHLATGLKIGIHTGGGQAAFDEIEILNNHGVDAAALIVIHAQNASIEDQQLIVQKGAWVSLDGIKSSAKSINRYTEYLLQLKQNGYLDQTLISQDAYWSVEQDEPGNIFFEHHGSDYAAIFEQLIPALKELGFTDAEIDRLLIENPAKAYRVEVLQL
jgi:predicted metal-dependent phosphotriesterase family hydrolase